MKRLSPINFAKTKSLDDLISDASMGINIESNQKTILNSKSAMHCYYFAKRVHGANVQLLSEVVLESNNIDWINNFYLFINFDKKMYESYFRNLIFK